MYLDIRTIIVLTALSGLMLNLGLLATLLLLGRRAGRLLPG